MNADIKAIQTWFKGCRFRSRTEARWAVFFESLGLNWEYEPQGYVLGGRPYLPDFWVREFDSFIEIKPDASDMQAAALCQRLATESGKRVLLLRGPARVHAHTISVFPVCDEMGLLTYTAFGTCRRCPAIAIGGDNCGAQLIEPCRCNRDHDCFPLIPATRTERAYQAAQSARFEHGESPAQRTQ